MVEATANDGKHAGEFLEPAKQVAKDLEEEFWKDNNDFPNKISINKLDEGSNENSCHKNVVYYKLNTNKKATWNWTIESSDENFFSRNDNNSINFR